MLRNVHFYYYVAHAVGINRRTDPFQHKHNEVSLERRDTSLCPLMQLMNCTSFASGH